MPRTFAYFRVSTSGQTTENQLREIEAAGFAGDKRRIVSEAASGSSAIEQRPGFRKLMERLEADDVLIVTKLDRLGRNAMDVTATVDRLGKLGVRVYCLALGGADLSHQPIRASRLLSAIACPRQNLNSAANYDKCLDRHPDAAITISINRERVANRTTQLLAFFDFQITVAWKVAKIGSPSSSTSSDPIGTPDEDTGLHSARQMRTSTSSHPASRKALPSIPTVQCGKKFAGHNSRPGKRLSNTRFTT
jgi:hypothetical protein